MDSRIDRHNFYTRQRSLHELFQGDQRLCLLHRVELRPGFGMLRRKYRAAIFIGLNLYLKGVDPAGKRNDLILIHCNQRPEYRHLRHRIRAGNCL